MKLHVTNGTALARILALLLGVTLVISGSLMGDEISWAAPGQNPNQQTVPPREEPPPPPPPPPPVPPAPAAPNQPSDTDTSDSSSDSNSGDQPSSIPDTSNRPTLSSSPTALPSQPNDTGQTSQPDSTSDSETIEDQSEPLPAGSSEPTNNNGSSPESFGEADLSLSKTVSNSAPNVGEVITYTIVISNSGPNLATKVGVIDLLPAGVNRIVVLSSQGYYYGDTGLWAVGILNPSQSMTLTIAVMVANAGIITNTAEITTTSLFDPDSIPANGLEREDDQSSVSISASIKPSDSPPQASSLRVSSTSPAAPATDIISLFGEFTLIHWIFALIVGVIFIFIGLFLVHHS